VLADPRVARQSNDIILKRVAQALGGHLFQRFGLPFAPIVASLPTDQPVLEVREQATDLLFRLEDKAAVDLEFQTTQRPDDLLRFAAYNLGRPTVATAYPSTPSCSTARASPAPPIPWPWAP